MKIFGIKIIQTTTYPSPPTFSILIKKWEDFKEVSKMEETYCYRNYRGEITLYTLHGNIRYYHEVKDENVKDTIIKRLYHGNQPYTYILEVLP